nr:MAG TPA: hypothetical protein [Caudoviricetes sp.]
MKAVGHWFKSNHLLDKRCSSVRLEQRYRKSLRHSSLKYFKKDENNT